MFDQVNSASLATVTLGAAKVTFSVTARVAGGTCTYSSTVAMLQAWTASWRCTGTRCFALPGDDRSTDGGQAPLRCQYGEVVASDGKWDLSTFPSLRDMGLAPERWTLETWILRV